MFVVALLPAVATLALAAGAAAPRNMLAAEISQEALAGVLRRTGQWRPHPTIRDRAEWESVPSEIRDAFVSEAERLRNTTWERIPASVILQFDRDGTRSNYDRMNTQQRQKLATLVLAEVLENRGRFLDDIANGIWALSEQTYWGSTAHLGMQAKGSGLPDVTEPTVDLFAAETGALLAWTDSLLGERLDTVSPLLRERIRVEVKRRLLTPALERDDFWWMGFSGRRLNNWNPWINSNWLTAVLLLEGDPERRQASALKIMRSLDRFIDSYPDDGASDEGPGYWGRAAASLFDALELLHGATAGAVDVFDHPLVRNMGQYIYRVYIKDDFFVNMGDASARISPDPELVYQYGKRIGDPTMQGFGAWLAQRRGPYQPGSSSPGRILRALAVAQEIAGATPAEPLLASAWLPDLQQMAARTTPHSPRGLYLSAWGGHNGQSHNHNDVGSFVVYADGKPLLIDVGVETYSARTFSPQRYEIWTMQSAYHNLPTINGVMQRAGREFAARAVSFTERTARVSFSADIAGAYPPDAAVRRWRRRLTLDRRAPAVALDEAYELAEWKAPARLNFITPLRVDTSKPGELHLADPAREGGGYTLSYDPRKLEAAAEEIHVPDARLRAVWGERLVRIVLTAKGRALRNDLQVIVRYAR